MSDQNKKCELGSEPMPEGDSGPCPGPSRLESPGFPKDEPMLKWFDYEHLPTDLQFIMISAKFHDLAVSLCQLCDRGPERTVALRKLLEAKDAAIRAKRLSGG